MPPQPVPIRVVYQGDLYVLSVDSSGTLSEILLYPNKENRLPMSLTWDDIDTFAQIHIQNELLRYNERLHIRDVPGAEDPDEDNEPNP